MTKKKSVILFLLVLGICFVVEEMHLTAVHAAEDQQAEMTEEKTDISDHCGWYRKMNRILYFDPDKFDPVNSSEREKSTQTEESDTTDRAADTGQPENDISAEEASAEWIITVGEGQMASSVTEAVQMAVTKYPECCANTASEPKILIEISEGTYYEGLDLDYLFSDREYSVSGILFRGIGDVTVYSEEAYPYAALCCFGANTYENITFVSTGDTAYAFHYEAGDQNFETESEIVFKNCRFEAQNNSAVGIGTAQHNTKIIFESCSFSGGGNDVFIHNCEFDGASDNYIEFVDCDLGRFTIHDAARFDADNSSKLTVCFTNSTYSSFVFYAGNCGQYADEVYDKPVINDNITFVEK